MLSVFSIFILITCSLSNNGRLEYALNFAGKNRIELEKVLTYYRNDPVKLAAAHFLIENIPFAYSYNGWQIDTIKAVLSREIIRNKINDFYFKVDDEVVRKWGNISFNNYNKIYDAHVITANYLIENVELAFKVWEEYSWNRDLSFDDFCELILPYRIGNEPLENWRRIYFNYYSSLLDSLYRGDSPVEACDIISEIINKEGFNQCLEIKVPNLGPLYLKDNRIGYCRDGCDFMLYAMRSIGIPTATDFYYYSPENRLGHSWNVVRDKTGIYLQCGYTVFGTEMNSRDDGRKKGKVYRTCSGLQKERFNYLSSEERLPRIFKERYVRDVTDNYFGKNEISIPVQRSKEKYAFLGIFDIDGWIPIDIGKVKKGNAIFHNIEPNIIYQVLPFKDYDMNQINYPFLYTGKEVKYFIPDKKIRENSILKRKYPIRFYTIASLNRHIRGGKFLGSNTRTFKKYEVLHEIKDSVTTNRNIIIFDKPYKYRYIRYKAPDGKNMDMADISIFGRDDKQLSLQLIDTITPIITNRKYAMRYIIDGDPLTYITSKEFFHITFDLSKQTDIHKIMFIPRSDDNFINPGETYELFYNMGDKGWKSLGKQIAETDELHYSTPKGALLWLRNLTKGKEEHIFYMKDGKQVFVADIK